MMPASSEPSRLTAAEEEEASRLEAELFGGIDIPAADKQQDDDEREDEDGGAQASVGIAKGEGRATRKRKKAVWSDPQDVQLSVDVSMLPKLRKLRRSEQETELTGFEYEQRLRVQHRKLHARTSWAAVRRKAAAGGAAGDGDEEADLEEDEVLLKAGGLTAGTARDGRLPGKVLEVTRVKDANWKERSKGVVQVVDWHENGELLLTAGLDKRVRLFQVDGVRNDCVERVFLEDLPVHSACFLHGGSHIVASGRRKWFYVYDINRSHIERVAGLVGWEDRSLEAMVGGSSGDTLAVLGDQGRIGLVSLKSRQLAGTLRMNGSVRCATFSPDGNLLFTSGSDGVVWSWDLRMRRCLFQLRDEGCIQSTSLACSASDLLACGSNTGVVNLYRHPLLGTTPPPAAGAALPRSCLPVKTAMNLTTSTDTLSFSRDAQILAMASRMKKDALRLLHVPSMTVFENWPTSRTPLHFVHCCRFSPGGGFLAVGNAKGEVLLYRLHHYSSA